MITFTQVLDSADELAPEDQESLIAVLENQLAERRRAELRATVASARAEFKAGYCKPATAKQILKRILA